MKDYSGFETEDFLMDDDFIHWVKSPDNDSKDFWNNWMTMHPEQQSKIELAVATIKSFSDQTSTLPSNFYTSLKEDIDTTIANNISINKSGNVLTMSAWMKVAAALVIVAVSVTLLYSYLQPAATIKVITAFRQVKTFELPDHSFVTLNANSSLEYSKNWNNGERVVTLKGEGFFKVIHIANQKTALPFTVHANGLDVEVLGTEFNVKSRDVSTNVLLQTGKVQLHINELNATHVMEPNDYISFNATTKKLNKLTVNPTYHTAWLNHKYIFTKATLSEVCKNLEDYYGLKFIIQNEVLANQEISGTLILEDVKTLLLTLASFLNTDITQQGRQITISLK